MSTSSGPFGFPVKIPAVDNVYGAGLIGTGLGLVLYGLFVHQVYRYFRLYPNDRLYIKIYVVVLMQVIFRRQRSHTLILRFVEWSKHSIWCFLFIPGNYFYLVTHYLDPGVFTTAEWSVNTVPLVTGVVAAVAQCFFAHRIYFVGHRYRWIVFVALILILAEVGFALAATIETYVRPTFSGFSDIDWVFSTSFAVALLIDIILTATLIYVLHKNRTGIKRTDSTIDILIIYAINTGLLTGFFNTLTLIFALVYPDNLIYSPFAIVTSKLYSNSVLAALNTRKSLMEGNQTVELDTFGVSFATPPGLGGSTTGVLSTPADDSRNGKSQVPAVISLKHDASDSEGLNGATNSRDMEDKVGKHSEDTTFNDV